jgi:uncharacterized membrane protein
MSEPVVPPPPPAPPAGSASSNRTLMLVLAYLGLLALIPLLVEKDDKEVQWHAKHGLVQFFLWVVVFVVLGVVTSTGVGCVFAILYPFVGLAALVVTVMSIIKAVNGQRFIIPGISDLANKF